MLMNDPAVTILFIATSSLCLQKEFRSAQKSPLKIEPSLPGYCPCWRVEEISDQTPHRISLKLLRNFSVKRSVYYKYKQSVSLFYILRY